MQMILLVESLEHTGCGDAFGQMKVTVHDILESNHVFCL